jgi:hypothetical protein
MSAAEDWANGYARQADADFRAWELYQKYPDAQAAECHALLFLQMACEKLCKAHLIRAGTNPDAVRKSHAYIAKPLPIVIKQEIVQLSRDLKRMGWVIAHVRQLAGEIELLNPAMDRDGRREDNCEYPWETGGAIFSPLDHTFAPSALLTASAGRTFLKLLKSAIRRNLPAEQRRVAE